IGVSGRITVLDQLVKVNLSLPMAAYAYRGAAEKMIREYLEPRLI
ncbi:MAG: polyhydroxyalkanoic acid system family protein, partial [Alphaproteobacteria bacterium]|nr:polyhydroxyalkanoic acid system family protein [Alphaproteobacteria bacterium]